MFSPDYTKRHYLLPKGCKDLIDVINLHKAKPPFPWHTTKSLQTELETSLEDASSLLPPITGEILVSQPITVGELAKLLSQKPFMIIADLMMLGVFATV